jgi:DNA-binding MarR family transcriptional regulator
MSMQSCLTKSDFAAIVDINNGIPGGNTMEHYTPRNFLLTDSIGFALVRARNLIASEMDAALKPLDITSPQMGVMLSIRAGTATTPFELSKLLGIDTGLMTRMLDKLEGKGLVERSRSVDDRRVVNLALTGKGEALAAKIPEIAPKVLNARLRKFTKAEFEELGRLLRKFSGD